MKPRGDVEWIRNERPVKLWRTMDWLFGFFVALTVGVELGIVYFFSPSSPILAVLYVFVPGFLAGYGTYLHYRYRSFWPLELGLSKDGIDFRFAKDKGLFLPWDGIRDIRLEGSGRPSMFGLFQAIILGADGKPYRAGIYGNAASTLKQRFDRLAP